MHVQDKHTDKPVSAYGLFKGQEGSATAIQIQGGEQLKEHTTKTEALLICLSGHVRFENANGRQEELQSGDYLIIEPLVKHWVDGVETSQLVLLK